MARQIRTDLLGKWYATGNNPPGEFIVVFDKEWGDYHIVSLEDYLVKQSFTVVEFSNPVPKLEKELKSNYRR